MCFEVLGSTVVSSITFSSNGDLLLILSCSDWKMMNSAGITTIPNTVPTSIPPTAPVPIDLFPAAPTPVITSGEAIQE